MGERKDCLEMWFSDMVDNLFFFFFFSCRLLGRVERWCGGLGVWGMRVGG